MPRSKTAEPTPFSLSALALDLANEMERRSFTSQPFTDWRDLPNGMRVRAKMESDNDRNLFSHRDGSSDCDGQIFWPERHSRQRPAGCDGSARKLVTRDGYVWWQPPADVVNDAAILENVRKRVQGWFYDQWHYVGIIVETESAPCTCCNVRKEVETFPGSLWGIESDSGTDYFAEVIGEMLPEICALCHDTGRLSDDIPCSNPVHLSTLASN